MIDFIEGKQLGQVVIDDAIESTIKQYEQLQSILVAALFCILVFLLIILNLFTSQLISRRKIEIALWMTVGYTRGQILNLMWSQIFCFMLIGFTISLPFTTATMKILKIYMRHFCVTAISANPSVYFYICLAIMLLVINIYVIWSIHRRTKKIQPKEMFIKEL
ncbi:ABC transporter permease [Clostridiales bacterium]|nr:ABC transporter permease [Clostridiales bacterium]